MRKIIKKIYMFFLHPIIFLRLSVFKKDVLIRENSKIKGLKYLDFGNNCRIGKNCRIDCYDEFFGEKYNPQIKIGNDVYIGDYFSILCTDKMIIENNVTIASHVLITTENHSMNPLSDVNYGRQPLISKPVTIKEGCWIGEKVIVLPGIEIGEKSIIGAGSIVTKNIPAYSIAAGNPAKIIKQFNFSTKQWEKIN